MLTKKTIIFSVIIIILFVAVSILYLFTKSHDDKTALQNNIRTEIDMNKDALDKKNHSQIENVDINLDETIDTSDWQTYRNEEYEFEFKYPHDWIISESNCNECKMMYSLMLDAEDGKDDKTYFSVFVWNDVSFVNARQGLMDRMGRLSNVDEETDEIINNISVYCIKDRNKQDENLKMTSKCAFLNGKKLIVFEIYKAFESRNVVTSREIFVDNSSNVKNFEEIIKSFRFDEK